MNSAPISESLRPPVLRAVDVRKSLGGREILRGVSLEVRRGDLMVLIGPAGGG
jgi:ABC-type branched-subunit amino acid transport system ATPase component